MALLAGAAGAVLVTAALWRLDPPGAWRVVLANALWWSGVAAGAGAFECLLVLTGAEWATSLLPAAQRLSGLLPAAAVAVAALAAGMWPLFHTTAIWVPVRDAAALAALYGVFRGRPHRRHSTLSASIALVLFTAVLSLLAIDLVMRFDEDWSSTLFPAFFAFAGLYAGVAIIVLCTPFGDSAIVGDLSRVLLGLVLVWVYLFWSQYLVIWYGNLPHEFVFFLPRTNGGWRAAAAAVLICCAAAPFLLLLPRRSRAPLLAAAVFAAAGLWLEMLLLVYPPLEWRGVDGAIALAATAAGALLAIGVNSTRTAAVQ